MHLGSPHQAAGWIVCNASVVRWTATSPARTWRARGTFRSFSQAAITTVATQLPIRLPSARAIPINQSIDNTNTSPMAGIAGTAFSVAARMTMADPGTPCAPFEVRMRRG